MDGNAAHLTFDQLAFPGVQPDADVDPQTVHSIPHGTAAANCPCGPVERREEAVPCRVHLASLEAGELRPDERMVLTHELAPASIAQLDRLRRRVDDVCEQHRRED